MAADLDSELLDIAQAAALLRVSEASLRRWTNSGRLPCRRIGGRRERRFRRADLMAFLERDASNTGAHHVCAFYASDQARTRQAASFIGNGLDAGSVCILAAERRVRERVLARLARRRPALRALVMARPAASSVPRASARNASPADVSRTPRGRRLNNVTPSSVSRSRICFDRAGCATRSRRAACAKLCSSATATK